MAGYGGEQRAAFVYQTAAYDFWAEKLKWHDLTFGQCGENFTVEGLATTTFGSAIASGSAVRPSR